MASFKQNLNFKIQMLAGNSLKVRVSAGSQISLTLVYLCIFNVYLQTKLSKIVLVQRKLLDCDMRITFTIIMLYDNWQANQRELSL